MDSTETPQRKELFIVWRSWQGRVASMAPYFGFEAVFIDAWPASRWLRPLTYVVSGFRMLRTLLARRPEVVWIQLPPTVLLYVAFLYRAAFAPGTVIVADCHNSTMRQRWRSLPLVPHLLRHSDIMLVHNWWVRQQAEALGFASERLHVLETRPALMDPATTASYPRDDPRYPSPFVLVPCWFAPDEPIAQIFEAARRLPAVTFVVTGPPARAAGVHDLTDVPPNVVITGFLPRAEYEAALRDCTAVLVLTLWEGVQLSGANEAVGAGKALVTSGTEVMRDLFHSGAVYVDAASARDITRGCAEALERRSELEADIHRLRAERHQRWNGQAVEVKTHLDRLVAQCARPVLTRKSSKSMTSSRTGAHSVLLPPKNVLK